MTLASGTKIADTLAKNPAAGQIVGYGLIGVGTAAIITGYGVLKVTEKIIG